MDLAVTRQAIIDTGPLVAFLDRDEKHHKWTVEQVQQLAPPLLVCEAVLTESMFLLQRVPAAQSALFGLLGNGALTIQFTLAENILEIGALLLKYQDRPMSLSAACVVRMAEQNMRHSVFTLDSDFHIYRKHGREAIKLVSPKPPQKGKLQ
jgi:predicted nucleic acid-binding protein